MEVVILAEAWEQGCTCIPADLKLSAWSLDGHLSSSEHKYASIMVRVWPLTLSPSTGSSSLCGRSDCRVLSAQTHPGGQKERDSIRQNKRNSIRWNKRDWTREGPRQETKCQDNRRGMGTRISDTAVDSHTGIGTNHTVTNCFEQSSPYASLM